MQLGSARESLKRLMRDRCIVTAPAGHGEGVLNETTMEVGFDAPPIVYSGCCSIQRTRSARDRSDAGRDERLDELRVAVPASVSGIYSGCMIKVTASDDCDLVGVELEVLSAHEGTNRLSKVWICRQTVQYPSTGGPV